MLFDQLGDFVQQIPAILYLYICVPLGGLSLAMAWFAWIKPRLNKKQNKESPLHPPQFVEENEIDSESLVTDIDMADMPDLNMLISRPPLEPTPKPAQPEQPATTFAPVSRSAPIQKGTKYKVKLYTGDMIESEELVSVLRDPRDGHLVVYIDDTGYRTLVDSPNIKARFVQIMKELSDVVTKPDESPIVEDSPAKTDYVEDIEDIEEEITSSPEPEPIINTAPPPPINEAGEMPGDLPSFKLEDNPGEPVKKGRFGRVQMDYQPVPELNIAGAIEAYLQHKLKHTPEYYRRNIHVHSAPDGGVRIEVDGQFYEAVGDVDDPEIRAFLGATIQEWQDRQ